MSHKQVYVGNFAEAMRMLNEIDFPEALVANTTLDKFLSVLRQRKLVGGL